jgi:plastocyanin
MVIKMNRVAIQKFLGSLFFLGGLIIVLSSCTIASGNSTTSSGAGSANQVHMQAMSFTPEQITIKKGQSIELVNDLAIIHVIANGTWNGSAPAPKIEAGAPKVDNIQVNGNDTATIGPFNTAGTFQLYCTVHVGMKMTVVVQ